jgi:hypothetical protein
LPKSLHPSQIPSASLFLRFSLLPYPLPAHVGTSGEFPRMSPALLAIFLLYLPPLTMSYISLS